MPMSLAQQQTYWSTSAAYNQNEQRAISSSRAAWKMRMLGVHSCRQPDLSAIHATAQKNSKFKLLSNTCKCAAISVTLCSTGHTCVHVCVLNNHSGQP